MIFSDVSQILTLPNEDAHRRMVSDCIRDFCCSHPNAKAFESLGQQLFLSCMKHFNGVVGGSSSGLA